MSVEQFGKDLANVVMPPDIIPDQKAKIEGLWTGIATVITDNMKEGVTASRYWMVMTADKIVYDPNEDTLTPDVINIRAWQQAGTEAPFSPLVKWRIDGGTWSETPSETYQLSNIDKTAKNIIVEISKDEDHVLDSETLPILDSASDKYTIDLSNNFAMLSANSDGVVFDYSSANTIVKVYRGAGLIDTNIVIYLPTGITATYDGATYVNGTPVPSNKILQLTGVANYIKNANIHIYLDIDPNIETTFNLIKPSDGKEGTGISAITSWITSDANIVIFNPSSNTYDKTEVVLSAWYRQGADSVQPLAVQWRVSGGVWSTDYTSTLTVPIGGNTGKTSDFTVEISIDSGSHILDSETIAILSTTSDTVTIQLTQDSHVIATDKDNIALPSSLALATTIPYVYRGATRVNEKIYISVPDGVEVTYDGAVYPSDTPVAVDPGKVLGISYISLAVRGAIITFYTANPEISPPIEKVFVLATAPTGATGYNARSVVISTSKQAFVYDSEGNLKPSDDTATITASTIGSPEGINIYYEFIVDGISVQNALSPTYVYTPPALYSNMPDIIDVKVREELSTSEVVSQDQMTFVGLREGGNAITVLLSNEAHTLPTQNNGSVNYDGSGTSIKVWEGTTPLITDNSSPYSNSSFRVTIESGDAINVTPGAATYNTYDVTYGNCSALTQDIGTITFTIIVTNSAGGQLTLTKTQSLSKSLQGNNGIVAVATYADLAGITSVFDGMVAFTQDTKKFYVYNATLARWEIQRVHVDGDVVTGNLVDNSMWEIGTTGSQLIDDEIPALAKGYLAQYSDPIQNVIIKGVISSGLESPIWKSEYLGTYEYGRGWNTTYFTVDPNKTYRYVVFIKRTDWSTNGGTTLFGFGTNDGTAGAIRLSDGLTIAYPYFMENATTTFDPTHWYCYVGFIHGNTTSITSNQGAIYDCTTGLKVYTLVDFRWLATTTTANHRTYFANCTNLVNNIQFMTDPRVEEVTGKETQISTLIKNSFITILPEVYPKYLGVFTYDARPATANYGDLIIVKALEADAVNRGFYQWGIDNSWIKIAPADVTTQMISQAWADICTITNETGYGTVVNYVGNGVNFIEVLGTNVAFINELYANQIEIQNNGLIRSSTYDNSGNLVSGQTKGFYLNYDGTFKASDAYFSGSLYSSNGSLGNFTLDTAIRSGKVSYDDDQHDGIYLGSDGIGLGKGTFIVTADGTLTATNANIAGEINASTGSIGYFSIGNYLNSGEKQTYNDDVAGVHLGADGIGLGSLFKVSADGNLIASSVDVSGEINASTGTIGSFTIGDYLNTGSKATYNDGVAGVHLGSDGIGLGANFKVSAAGALTASSANITGVITATSGSIGSFTIGTYLTTNGKAAYNDSNSGIFIGSTGIGFGAYTSGFSVSNTGAVIARTIKASLQECIISDVTIGNQTVKEDNSIIYYTNNILSSWYTIKTLQIAATGKLRVQYSVSRWDAGGGGGTQKCRIYYNDTPVGPERTLTAGNGVVETFTDDISSVTFTAGQLVCLKVYTTHGAQLLGPEYGEYYSYPITARLLRVLINESPGILTYLGTNADSGITITTPIISVTNDQSTNAAMYPIFVQGTSGSQTLKTNTGFYYNPSTNALTVGTASATNIFANSISTTGAITVGGNLTVNGTVTTINSTELTVDDKNIELGSVTTPTDSTANGGGIILRGSTDKSILWSNVEGDWISNQSFSIVKASAGGRGGELNIVNNASTTTGNSAALNFGLENSTYTINDGNAQIKAILNGASGASTDMVFSLWDGDSFDEMIRIKSTGYVGIGTATPGAKLTVQGSATELRVQNDATNALVLGGYSSGVNYIKSINLGTAFLPLELQASRFNFTQGNVGVNIASTFTSLTLPPTSSSGTLGWEYTSGQANARRWWMGGDAIEWGGFYIATESTQGRSSSDLTRFYISPTGNVGIGTTSPGTNLTVAGTTRFGFATEPNTYYLDIAPRVVAGGDVDFDLNFSTATGPQSGTLMTYDLSAQRIGIGITSPSSKLHVAGDISTDSNGKKIGFNVSDGFSGNGGTIAHYGMSFQMTETPLALSGYYGLNFFSTGSERMRIALNGNVGIGTASPQCKLDVAIGSNAFATVGASTNMAVNDFAGIHFGYREDGNSLYRKSAIVFERTDNGSSNANGKIHILNGPYSGSSSASLSDAKLTIDEFGRVGIGTKYPDTPLQVFATKTDDSYSTLLKLTTTGNFGGGTQLEFDAIGSYAVIELNSAYSSSGQRANSSYADFNIVNLSSGGTHGAIRFYTNDTHRMSITAGGNVGIGTVSPSEKLHVDGGSIYVNSSGTGVLKLGSGGSQLVRASSLYQFISDSVPFVFKDTATELVRITTTGSVGIGTNNPSYGKLEISSNTLGENAFLSFAVKDGTYNPRVIVSHVTAANDHYVKFDSGYSTGTGQADWIFNSGNVGIGTTTPVCPLQVISPYAKTDTTTRNTLYLSSNDVGDTKFSLLVALKGATAYANRTAIIQTTTAGEGNGGNISFQPDGGNVGIGTTSPTSLLDIQKATTVKTITDFIELTNSGVATNMDGTGTGILFNQYYYDATTPAVADAGRIAILTETDWTSTATTHDSAMVFQTALDGTVAERVRITSGGKLGIGTDSPTNTLSLGGNSDQTIWMERNTTANIVGKSLYIQAGGATTSATNKNGGDLYLRSGISTGTGYSNIYFDTVSAGVTGTADNSLTTKMVITGVGNVGVGTVSPVEKIHVEGNIRVDDASGNDGFKISYNNSSKTLDFIFVGV